MTGAAASAPPDDAPLLRSGLALAGANEPPTGAGDGLLTALEATGLDLNGTQLVVLSACETGVGELHAGEGVFGLRRAFVIAGARSLVMSLWKVDDAATRDLMVAYYTRLRAGQPRTSLREVQLAMLADPRTTHPYFWASFILQGERGPLEARPSSASSIHGRRGCGCHGGTRDIGLVVAAALLLVLRRSRGSPSWRQP